MKNLATYLEYVKILTNMTFFIQSSLGLSQRANSNDNALKAKLLDPSANRKPDKNVAENYCNHKPSKSLDDAPTNNQQSREPTLKGLSLRNKNKGSLNTQNNPEKLSISNDLIEKSSLNKEKLSTQPEKPKKVDENDVSAFANSYNALDDYYPLDKELNHKVQNIDLTDDGFGICEPCDIDDLFDF